MKKIFTTLALAGLCFSGAIAQKNVDLKFSILYPVNNASYPNMASGDSMIMSLKIENLGTDAVATTDTINLWRLGYYIMKNSTGNYVFTWIKTKHTGFNIPAGQSTNFNFSVKKNTYFLLSNGDTVINWFKNNDTNFLYVEGYGRSNNGVLFNDPGVNNADPDANNALTGNNHAEVQYILGTPGVGIKDVLQGLAKDNIVIYPNPTSKDLNFKYNFAKAGEATLRILDVTGRVVMTRDLGKQNIGEQTINLNVSTLSNGLYNVELVSGDRRAVGKFTISK